MTRGPDEICNAMQNVRTHVDQDLTAIKTSVRTLLDWKYYVRKHPIACLGGAALLGILLAPRAKRPATGRADKSSLAPSEGAEALDSGPTIGNVLRSLALSAGPPLVRIGLDLAAQHLQSQTATKEETASAKEARVESPESYRPCCPTSA
jgi:hypothetical protein